MFLATGAGQEAVVVGRPVAGRWCKRVRPGTPGGHGRFLEEPDGLASLQGRGAQNRVAGVRSPFVTGSSIWECPFLDAGNRF